MKRKIVQHGPSTLIVSLPSIWVKQHNIKKGDELDVREEGKTLIIGVEENTINYSIREDISSLKPYLISQFLSRAYQKGYDSIYLVHNSLDLLKEIQEKNNELIGFEMIEQNDKNCLIRSLTQKLDLDFDNSLRKGFLIIKIMLETCVKTYSNTNNAALQNINLDYNQVKRYCSFCMRQINKSQYAAPEIMRQSHILYSLIGMLEELGNSIRILSENIIQAKKKNNKIFDLLKMMTEQYAIAYSYFYKADVDKANGAYHLYININENIKSLVNTKLSGLEILTIYSIKDSSYLIHHFTTMRLDFLKELETEQ